MKIGIWKLLVLLGIVTIYAAWYHWDRYQRTHWPDSFKAGVVTGCIEELLPKVDSPIKAHAQCLCTSDKVEMRGVINPHDSIDEIDKDLTQYIESNEYQMDVIECLFESMMKSLPSHPT